MKKIILFLSIFCLIGCSDEETIKKDEYLTFKEKLLEKDVFSTSDDINFNINTYIDRIDEEEVSYRVIIDNPKENMHNIKAIAVHDYFTDEIFPSIGIFDKTVNLIVNDEEIKGINLIGYIKTTKDIKDLDLNIKIYIEYTDDNAKLKKIYYKSQYAK